MVVTLVILAGAFVYTLQSNAASATVESEVHGAFANHLSDFSTANSTILTGDYGPSATVIWTGDTRNWGGSYMNSSRIQAFFTRYFSVYITDSMYNITYSVQTAGSGATVDGSVQLIGLSITNQSMSASILTQDTYLKLHGEWEITSETWTFQSFNILPPFYD